MTRHISRHYSLFNADILCLRGEDNVDSFKEAKKELTSKIYSWNIMVYGDLPYTLCFACDQFKIQFYALDPQHNLHEITDILYPSDMNDRGTLIHALFNMSLLIEAMPLEIYFPSILSIKPKLFRNQIRTTTGVKLIYFYSNVKKEYSNASIPNVDEILEVYQKLALIKKPSK